MFTTGFYMKAQEVADEEELALTWMKNFAKTKNAAIGGSVSVKDNDKFYNRFYFVNQTELTINTIKDIFFLTLEKIKCTLQEQKE